MTRDTPYPAGAHRDTRSAEPVLELPPRAAHERVLAGARLIDIRDPAEPYSAADFRTDALAAIADSHAAGRIPLLVGGTMLYFRALRDGLATLPVSDPALRARLNAELARDGRPALAARLAAVDPAAAAKHGANPQRLLRALEVWELTGRSLRDAEEG